MCARRADPPYPQFEAKTRAEWRAWLRKNHKRTRGVWLVTFKKGSGEPHVTNNDVVEEALAFGWIDSLPRKLDDTRTMLLVTPRKAHSSWSMLNQQRVKRLIAARRMTAAGLAKVEAAKQDGSWDRLTEVEALTIPPDLIDAFKGNRQSRMHFEAFPRSSKRGILEWILNAKRPETRARRIEQTVTLAARNVRANQYRP